MARVKVDFTGVTTFVKAAEGKHIAKIIEIENNVSSGGDDMLSAKLQIVDGESTGAIVYDNYLLTQKMLWKLKGVLENLGMKSDKKVALDTDKMLNKNIGIVVFHEDYNGQMKAKIDSYFKAGSVKSVVADDDIEDDFDDDFEEDEVEVIDFSKMGKADLQAACKEHGVPFKGKKADIIKALEEAIKPDDDGFEDDDWEDDEDDWEE